MPVALNSTIGLEKDISRLAERSEAWARLMLVIHAQQIEFLAFRYAHLVACALSTVSCSFSLMRLDFALRAEHRSVFRTLDQPDLPSSEVLKWAKFFGDASRRLYRIADIERRAIKQLDVLLAKRRTMDLRIQKSLGVFFAEYHEKVAIRNEDVAETLALSANEAFSAAVQDELRCQNVS